MFSRRMFSSTRIPQTMFRSLKISSQRQSLHILPSLIVVPKLLSSSTGATLCLVGGGAGACTSLSDEVGGLGDFMTVGGIEEALSAILAELWRPCGVNMAMWIRTCCILSKDVMPLPRVLNA